MKTEEKQLLLKDLCARLPYRTKILITGEGGVEIDADLTTSTIDYFMSWTVQPYLRPMSSMTDEEEILFRCELPTKAKTDAQLVAMRMELFLKGHLDYNHLIEKGLALEAPKDMYKEK